MSTGTPLSLADLKHALCRFSAERAQWPRARIEEEFGELLVYLIRTADQAGIDLFEAGKERLSPTSLLAPKVPRTP